VLAAYTEGARRGRAVVLLPAAEVVQVLEDPAGLTGTGQERGVQLRMPGDRAPVVVAAIATARIFVVKAPGLATDPAATEPPPSGTQEPRPGTDAPGGDPATGSPGEAPAYGAPPDTGSSELGSPDSGSPGATSPDPGPPDTGQLGAGPPSTSSPGTSATSGVAR
jgi:hypothetical protein